MSLERLDQFWLDFYRRTADDKKRNLDVFNFVYPWLLLYQRGMISQNHFFKERIYVQHWAIKTVDDDGRRRALAPSLSRYLIVIIFQASALAVELLAPEMGSTILDMCAAPGMKTTQVAAYVNNNVR